MASKAKAETTETTETVETTEGLSGNLFGLFRKIVLANLGAVALAQEEIEAFINKLIEKGEVAEKEGRKFLQDVTDKRKEQVVEVEDELTRRIEDVLNRMAVPSKSDIKGLGNKITELTKKIDALKSTES